jgi:hypothetical protein
MGSIPELAKDQQGPGYQQKYQQIARLAAIMAEQSRSNLVVFECFS